MKRIIAVALIVVVIVVLIGCGAKESTKYIFNLVEKNYGAILEACEQQDKEALLAIDGITEINIVDGYIVVYCKGTGIAPSSQDYGFYYSKEESPVAVDCNLNIVRYAADLSPEAKGYQCVVSGNTFYTEHIKGNIYFYSNAY